MTARTESAPQPSVSFEFFPPHSPEASARLWRSVERLAPLGPRFVSVTYGAGGTTRERTMAAIQTIRDRARLPVAGHLTCVGATRDETLEVARGYARVGARAVVALRGDPPKGAERFEPHPDGFASAAELVEALRADGVGDIYVGAYPEVHPEAPSPEADLDALKRKVDAGATAAITQFCFDTALYLRFRDRAARAGIGVPIHPGILPIENFAKMSGFAARCGARVPEFLARAFARAETAEEAFVLAVATAADQCDRLRTEGVGHLHFYTLNNPDLTFDICRALGIEARPLRVAANGCG